jgi:hypothetical protein
VIRILIHVFCIPVISSYFQHLLFHIHKITDPPLISPITTGTVIPVFVRHPSKFRVHYSFLRHPFMFPSSSWTAVERRCGNPGESLFVGAFMNLLAVRVSQPNSFFLLPPPPPTPHPTFNSYPSCIVSPFFAGLRIHVHFLQISSISLMFGWMLKIAAF